MEKANSKVKNRKKVLLWLGTLLILAGVTLAAYPFLQNAYYRHVQANDAAKLMEELEEGKENIEEENNSPREENPAFLPEEEAPDYPQYLEPGEGILEIPGLEISIQIGYGVETEDLKSGPGFYPHSGFPDTGNVSIAGHRTTYGAPFYSLHRLQEDDLIKLYYQNRVYTYRVAKVFDTHTRDWSVIDPTPEPALTLTTCHPIGGDHRRLVVRGYLDEANNSMASLPSDF